MTTEIAERVEILNNGSHLGWADVIAGKWNYPCSGLGAGLYSLTARYRGKVSPLWSITVRERTETEDFENVPIGRFQSLPRPQFTVRLVTGDAWGENTSPSFNSLQIYAAPPGMGPGTRSLYFNVRINALDYSYLHTSQVVDLEFDQDYSSISFSGLQHFTNAFTSGVEAFDRSGNSLKSENFNGWNGSVRVISMTSSDNRKISRLRFSMLVRASSVPNMVSMFVDNVVMTA